MDLPRLSPPHMYAGLSKSPASPKEFSGKSPPGAPEVRQERKQGKTPRPAKTGACREGKVPVRAPKMWGISGARASATAPTQHRKPPRRSGRAPGPPGHTRASRAGAAPLTPRPPPRQEGGGPAGAPAAGIHLRGTPQLSPGLSPPNLNSPQQGDLGGQGLRHGPSAVLQAAEAVREGSRSSGSHSRLARRCDAAHPASSSTTGGGGGSAGAPAAGNHFRGTPPALTGPLAASQPAAVNFVGAPKPTSDPPGASRSGRHLELLFTGAAGSPYEGEPLAFH
ncbi:hypothetical protein NDU88_003127 [Pleurodeles waltl]|uniref:Uncharacterized protein n=1 Tax=Pleurodeles waltl TaxID=8319 RepID=A0AAV7KU03_PLEWA|nr:hypothetical protein NDU88_003127 [Pleurodeles waltl]